jgi:hypothetical protein
MNCNFSIPKQFYLTTMRYPVLALAALWFVCVWTSGIAQRADEGGAPKLPPRPGDEGDLRSRFVESLPPEMRERFEAAREKALQDPKLRELRKIAERANRDFFKAMREKMMEIDPALADIVRKTVLERKARKAWKDEDGAPGFDSLSGEEREKFMAALEKAHNDPALEAAKRKRWEAITSGERAIASEEYRKALQEAMLKVDPSLAPILKKLSSKRLPSTPPASPEKSNPSDKEPQPR